MDYHCFEGGGRREVKERGSIFSRFAANVETVFKKLILQVSERLPSMFGK